MKNFFIVIAGKDSAVSLKDSNLEINFNLNHRAAVHGQLLICSW